MHIEKNPNDQLPAQTVENRGKTYQRMMDIGYVWGLPITLAIVMFLTLLLMDTNWFLSLIISFFTWLGVLGFSKTFFVH
ncbi:hypothetical protein [Parvularcula maris]|uniref:Uncharacterized protein n=1 Tax=Parvularcula maris TaxID=2965077 RepID=A0A9X2LBB9_9PROT|nr:hypothetical protein [Parvularcula maris]MCQ8185392.1 hypothetical protein [Parvularcula maris]